MVDAAANIKSKTPPLRSLFEEGFYIGTNDGSAENLVLTPTGIVKCRTIRRKPPRERWCRSLLEITGASEMQPTELIAVLVLTYIFYKQI